ncbi:MAG: ABC transporter ATP-binding protein [Desulfobacteraceae bacterium]|nr:MAG: ABC transporter ATP-binding protein [Desulfobacteraceae bacterium]
MALLEVTHIDKSYGAFPALRQVGFTLEQSRILGILGPSGCGKTTLLRILAGIETPDSGSVLFAGQDLAQVPPHRRNFGMMFQDFALFPHKTVFDNVAYGLLRQKLPSAEIRSRVHGLLALFGLEGFSDRRIDSLSGGEQQRIALARSLAPRPRLLLLDEPMGSLDRELRERLVPELKAILQQVNVTAIFVTHDHAEAFAMADSVAVMDQGCIAQLNTPENLFRQPRNQRVASFLGFENFLNGVVRPQGGVETPMGVFYPANLKDSAPGRTITLLIRPEAAETVSLNNPRPQEPISKNNPSPITVISGTVSLRLFQGKFYRLKMKTPAGLSLTFDLANDPPPPPLGSPLHLAVFSSGVVWLD